MTNHFQKEAQHYSPFLTLKWLLTVICPFMQTSLGCLTAQGIAVHGVDLSQGMAKQSKDLC